MLLAFLSNSVRPRLSIGVLEMENPAGEGGVSGCVNETRPRFLMLRGDKAIRSRNATAETVNGVTASTIRAPILPSRVIVARSDVYPASSSNCFNERAPGRVYTCLLTPEE